jgi:hypothetical protein
MMAHDVRNLPAQSTGYLQTWNDDLDHPANQRAKWYLEQIMDAWSRKMPLTDDKLLRQLLDFTRLKIEALSPVEQTTLSFDLLARFVIIGPNSTPIPIPNYLFSDSELVEIQAQVAEGLRLLMDEPGADWVLPNVSRRATRVSGLGHIETRFSVVYSPNDPTAMVVNAIADFIVRAGQRLRVCANCRALFVANKRQAYCSPSCSQAKRTQRKRDRMQPVSTDEVQWYTRQKQA